MGNLQLGEKEEREGLGNFSQGHHHTWAALAPRGSPAQAPRTGRPRWVPPPDPLPGAPPKRGLQTEAASPASFFSPSLPASEALPSSLQEEEGPTTLVL